MNNMYNELDNLFYDCSEKEIISFISNCIDAQALH